MAIKGDNAYNRDQNFWETYIKGRPAIPQSFFDQLFAYHSGHQGSFDTAHEVGAGVGVHSPRLASKFKHIVVSDIIPSNVEIARERLSSPSTDQYSFHTTSLEDSIDVIPAESVDFVFASTMMHFCEIDEAIRAVYHQLKPGGTFAAGLYGTYALSNPAAQKIWARMVLTISTKIVERYGFREGDPTRLNAKAELVLQNESSGLDCVAFPEGKFVDVERYDWNYPTRTTQREMIVNERFDIQPVNRVGESDKVVREVNREWYTTTKGLEGLRAIAESWPHDENDPEIKGLWGELEAVVGDGEVEGFWMVSLVLATKK